MLRKMARLLIAFGLGCVVPAYALGFGDIGARSRFDLEAGSKVTPMRVSLIVAGHARAQKVNRESRDPRASPARWYGPVTGLETFWSIASKLRPSGATVDQTLWAVGRANSEVFYNGRFDGLRNGVLLNVPSAEAIESIPPSIAAARVAQWRHGVSINHIAVVDKPAPDASLKTAKSRPLAASPAPQAVVAPAAPVAAAAVAPSQPPEPATATPPANETPDTPAAPTGAEPPGPQIPPVQQAPVAAPPEPSPQVPSPTLSKSLGQLLLEASVAILLIGFLVWFMLRRNTGSLPTGPTSNRLPPTMARTQTTAIEPTTSPRPRSIPSRVLASTTIGPRLEPSSRVGDETGFVKPQVEDRLFPAVEPERQVDSTVVSVMPAAQVPDVGSDDPAHVNSSAVIEQASLDFTSQFEAETPAVDFRTGDPQSEVDSHVAHDLQDEAGPALLQDLPNEAAESIGIHRTADDSASEEPDDLAPLPEPLPGPLAGPLPGPLLGLGAPVGDEIVDVDHFKAKLSVNDAAPDEEIDSNPSAEWTASALALEGAAPPPPAPSPADSTVEAEAAMPEMDLGYFDSDEPASVLIGVPMSVIVVSSPADAELSGALLAPAQLPHDAEVLAAPEMDLGYFDVSAPADMIAEDSIPESDQDEAPTVPGILISNERVVVKPEVDGGHFGVGAPAGNSAGFDSNEQRAPKPDAGTPDATLGIDEIGAKLDLARAYVDMGDHETADALLGQVIARGSWTQRREAGALRERLHPA